MPEPSDYLSEFRSILTDLGLDTDSIERWSLDWEVLDRWRTARSTRG